MRSGRVRRRGRCRWGLDFRKVRAAVRGGRSIRSAISRLRHTEAQFKSAEDTVGPTKPNKTLYQMAGYGEAASWGLQLAEDIAAWQAGLIDWEDVDRGAVLFGKPGCGKTTYGRVLAETCGIPIIEASSATWQAMGHLGDMLKAMRRTFKLASKKAPCILFIDEFDAFGDRSSNSAGDNLDYKRQVIDGLLECLDPPGGRPGVVVVAATNFPDVIDPALLRPGRLERLIGIPLFDVNRMMASEKYTRSPRPDVKTPSSRICRNLSRIRSLHSQNDDRHRVGRICHVLVYHAAPPTLARMVGEEAVSVVIWTSSPLSLLKSRPAQASTHDY